MFGRFHEAPLLACSGFGSFASFARCQLELGSGSGSGLDLDRGHGQRLGNDLFFFDGVQEGGFPSATARGTAVGGRLVGVLVLGAPLVAIAARMKIHPGLVNCVFVHNPLRNHRPMDADVLCDPCLGPVLAAVATLSTSIWAARPWGGIPWNNI